MGLLHKQALFMFYSNLLLGKVDGSLSFMKSPQVTVYRKAMNQLINGFYLKKKNLLCGKGQDGSLEGRKMRMEKAGKKEQVK